MQVFVYEHLCGGGPAATPVVDALRAEGWAMLRAALEDLAGCPGVRTVTLLGPSLRADVHLPANATAYAVRPGAEEASFRSLARAADFTLVIAPEFDNLLEDRCRWVEEEGGRLLGPCADAVRLAGDKLGLARHLHGSGIPTPPSVSFVPDRPALPFAFPLVCKPRQGAGSQATFLARSADELAGCAARARAEGWAGELILQPHVPGRPASVTLLQGPGRSLTLPAAEQTLSADGRFHYRGGRVPLPEDLGRRARELALQAAGAVAGLHGYFGVDLVLGPAADGSADAVIEINPRLTTSYVGLRRLARFNLMEALLAVATGAPGPAWEWRTEEVRFGADGRLGG
jgi:predicted ATP-grasp superfamily ATP-dependent carboligase